MISVFSFFQGIFAFWSCDWGLSCNQYILWNILKYILYNCIPVRCENNAESSRVQADFNSSSLASPWWSNEIFTAPINPNLTLKRTNELSKVSSKKISRFNSELWEKRRRSRDFHPWSEWTTCLFESIHQEVDKSSTKLCLPLGRFFWNPCWVDPLQGTEFFTNGSSQRPSPLWLGWLDCQGISYSAIRILSWECFVCTAPGLGFFLASSQPMFRCQVDKS